MKPIFRSKFRILLKNSTEYTPQIIFSIVNVKYNLLYCGLHEEESNFYFVLQNKTKMSSNVLKKLLTGLDIEDIYPYENLTGTVIQSEGKFIKRSRRDNPVCRSSTINNNTTNNGTMNIDNSVDNSVVNDNSVTNNNQINVINIHLNPIGSESMDHITPEFIQRILREYNDESVRGVFAFGNELYSLKENVNFSDTDKDGTVKAYCGERQGDKLKYEKLPTLSARDDLINNLVDKNEAAVNKYRGDIEVSDKDMNTFTRNIGYIRSRGGKVDAEDSKWVTDTRRIMKCIMVKAQEDMKEYRNAQQHRGKRVRLV